MAHEACSRGLVAHGNSWAGGGSRRRGMCTVQIGVQANRSLFLVSFNEFTCEGGLPRVAFNYTDTIKSFLKKLEPFKE